MSGLGGGGGNQPIIRAPGLRTPAEVAAAPPLGTDASKPLIVHVADSAYNGLPVQEMSLFSWTVFDILPAINTRQVLINQAVPSNQVLDVCGVEFFILSDDAAGDGVRARDEALFTFPPAVGNHGWYNITVNDKVPIDVTLQQNFVGVVVWRNAGFFMLNRNVLADWLATPVHIIVPEGQSLQVSFTSGPVLPAFGQACCCTVWGRWISKQAWAQLKERG